MTQFAPHGAPRPMHGDVKAPTYDLSLGRRLLYGVLILFWGALIIAAIVVSLPAGRRSASGPGSGAASPASVPVTQGLTTTVTIAFLSDYKYDPPPLDYDAQGNPIPPKDDPVPKKVRELSGRRISVDGFMIPIDFMDGTCTKFVLLSAPPTCCYGCSVLPNNVVDVTMTPGTRADCVKSGMVHVEGVLTIHGPIEELSPLYTLKAESVSASQ